MTAQLLLGSYALAESLANAATTTVTRQELRTALAEGRGRPKRGQAGWVARQQMRGNPYASKGNSATYQLAIHIRTLERYGWIAREGETLVRILDRPALAEYVKTFDDSEWS